MAAEKTAGLDPKRMVAIFYVLAALALGMFFAKVLGLVLTYGRWSDPAIFGEDWTLSSVVGFGLACAGAAIAWRNARAQAVSLEVAGELKKVTWPTLRETRAATVAVLVATVIAAAILGVFDWVWAAISSRIY